MVVVLLSHFMLFTLLNIVIPVVALTGVGFLMGRRHSARPDMAFINHANVTVFSCTRFFSAYGQSRKRWRRVAVDCGGYSYRGRARLGALLADSGGHDTRGIFSDRY